MSTIFQYTDYTKNTDIATQVCIIGTGCGGATLAKKLTDQGLDVVLLEQGGYYTGADMDQTELNMAGKISAERNLQTTLDGGTNMLFGNNVGGASVHYWADSYRTPEEKLLDWADRYGITGHTQADLLPAFEELETNLHVHEATDEYFNTMNQLARKASTALGWKAHRVPQARKNCIKSGHCMQGCIYGAKQSQIQTHIPTALNQGARLYADARAASFTFDKGRAQSLTVEAIDRRTNQPSGITLQVNADVFAVAAGGYNSSFFLMQQGLSESLPTLGKHFSMNPSTLVTGLYDQDIIQWRNIPSAWGIDEYRLRRYNDKQQYQEGGYLLMPNQLQPAALAAMIPGYGEVHHRFMSQLPRLGGTISWMDDIEDELGEIQLGSSGNRVVNYPFGPLTKAVLKDSLIKQCQLQFKAGARELIIAGYQGITLKSEADLHRLDALTYRAGGLSMGAPHPGGGCRMGKDPAHSVVNSRHQVHGLDNVYVSDSSVFPSSSSLDPSLTIMAFSHIAAQHISEHF